MFFVYLLLTVLLLSIMVIIHEFGHYIVAKIFKVTIYEFSVGMGPAIFTTGKKKKRHEKNSEDSSNDDLHSIETEKPEKTKFSLRAFPVGGYVSMAGEDGDSDDENAFCHKKLWQRFLIIGAGPAMNILLGILCMIIFVTSTAISSDGFLPSTTVAKFLEEGSVSNTGEEPLQVGDKIISINGTKVFTGNELVYEITNKGYQPLDIVVERNGERITLHNVKFPIDDSQGVSFGCYDFYILPEKATPLTVIKQSVCNSFSTVKMILNSLIDLIRGRYGIEAVSGPVGVTSVVGEAAQNGGFRSVLYLFTVITMNLGIFNLLPVPALDGGRLVFLTYELIVGKPPKKEVEQLVNGIGFILLMVLAVFVTAKDIFQLF